VAGIETHKRIGDAIMPGDLLFTLHGGSQKGFAEAQNLLLSATSISLQKPVPQRLITKRKVG
jgi:thymidine phosphorylase